MVTFAKVWYVRPIGSITRRHYDGISKQRAFHGLSAVVWGQGGLKAGDRLILCREKNDPPEFRRGLNINGSGTAGNPIIIESEDAGKPETIVSYSQVNYPGIDGYVSSKAQSFGSNAIGGRDIRHVIIRNINVERCGGLYLSNASNVTVQNVRVRDSYRGVYFVGGGDANKIENCRVVNTVSSCIALIGSDPATTTPLKDCIITKSECSNSLGGDGITLHRTSDEHLYDIGTGNQVVNNVCHHNKEEGLDITSGTGTLVEGNETYNNEAAGAVIWHGAQSVIFVRNFSHGEAGLLVGPEVGRATIAYNIFDSGVAAALRITQGIDYKVYNNCVRYGGVGPKPAALDIRNALNIVVANNIIVATNVNGYLLRMHYGTPESQNVQFSHNCWWHVSGDKAGAFHDIAKSSHDFVAFQTYSNVSDNIFSDPLVRDDYSLAPSSPCIDAGIDLNGNQYLKQDFLDTPVAGNPRDIGPIESPANMLTIPQNFRLLN